MFIKMFKSQLQEVSLIPFKKRQEMSILLNIREIQIKTTMRYHLTLVRMAFIKHSKNQGWRGRGEMRTFLHRCWNVNREQPLWKLRVC